MASQICMNSLCGAPILNSSSRLGWPLRSGAAFAILCHNCGTLYDQLAFCDVFHSDHTGWRDCISCGKRLHCGCIASTSLLEILDTSGVICIRCAKTSPIQPPQFISDDNGLKQFLPPQNHNTSRSMPPSGDTRNKCLSKYTQLSAGCGSPLDVKTKTDKKTPEVEDVYGSPVQTDLTISLATESITTHSLPITASKPVLTAGLDPNARTMSQMRVARLPVEGRIKSQLLPRYWPRITEQELQQISGDSNSTIVPLFEKILSASDAGRIGRLVLPKACAEAYFPPISQPEGIPVRIQDVKGKEWVFQFRFWPNNNSRMYVLEGVTPCIQSMKLQAGDTVTFSRMDPEGKLLMGFRKASNNIIMQAFSKHFSPSSEDAWHFTDKHGGRGMIGSLAPTLLAPERKRSKKIGSTSKRLLIDNQDALELKLTWDEIQEMLHPPASMQPTTVTIEDHEFEEYEAPPVLGKRSIFTSRSSGEQEQWTTCDCCFKWRRLPSDFLLPPLWRCQDNVWDHSRQVVLYEDCEYFKRRRNAVSNQMPTQEHDTPGILAGSSGQDDVSGPVATTTRHPRHRPGCSCIVCIQPPSGKGKHNPTCTCNVCMTVKRRFKTLMLRKKKRQSDLEAEIAQRNHFISAPKEEVEVDSTSRQGRSLINLLDDKSRSDSEPQAMDQRNDRPGKVIDTDTDELDLNCDPGEDFPTKSTRVSMMRLLQVATRPLETYLKQTGLTSLISEHHTSSGSPALPQAATESDRQPHQDQSIELEIQGKEPESDDHLSEPYQNGTDQS
ncbi:hypothetical protein DCAR_0830372 [Daucus carota subsp. sativus]|uniref:TF-B3 domain-containing protein n=1 Tax=Daucus carota subsp. sativus TaxID=79200 RepID=A0AAF1B972_DAUCS|nr:hypothetical protein DCAR_0830372 [Daucus carota subsp. sativus]